MKYVYRFAEGNANMRELLGGKGANLAEMTGLGLPVPEGFTITTEACTRYYDDGRELAPDILDEIMASVTQLEAQTGKKFGDPAAPLLVSVRSGARVSMPGMMDTILNLGINDQVAEALAEQSGNPRWAYDNYRRFIQMYGDVVMELSHDKFEEMLAGVREKAGVKLDSELSAQDLKELVGLYKGYYEESLGQKFPQEPREQLVNAVKAVFRSWDNDRANAYRRMYSIPYSWGTAVNVQRMAFGNMGNDSGTGVAFTRDPATGEARLYGEFLINAQGEDVVAGIRTPETIDKLAEIMPDVYEKFADVAHRLEQHYKDMQDMEFTIERGQLFMLQTRNGKRSAQAAMKIAVDMVEEGLCTKEEALMKIEPQQLDALLHPSFDPEALKAAVPVAKGLPASPGAACGAVYFTAKKAIDQGKIGPVLLVRNETSAEDVEGMNAAEGILTAHGGRTSHAAVVARQIGSCCVAGCGDLRIFEKEHYLKIGDTIVREGDFMSIDGSTGNVYLGRVPTVPAEMAGQFAAVMGWADEIRRLGVRANADTPADAKTALDYGAEGIGLCRTEHMFFDPNRIFIMRQMIVAQDEERRRQALDKLLPMQRGDFEGLFRVMTGKPVTIRLLDPPLHEFLPTEDPELKVLSEQMEVPLEELKSIVRALHEVNPMMGLRGCRLPILYPEIAQMQTQAIIEAAINVTKETGVTVEAEIMVPLVSSKGEIAYMRKLIKDTADPIIAASGVELPYKIGTMIEIPRAAMSADRIAEEAEFFSFGTNDLTQMSFGLSRDDAGRFLPVYLNKKILEHDPFERIDEMGTGRLVEEGVRLGRQVRPDMHMGICGEHGGEPNSIDFFHRVGLDYVSCSPYRVPIARLSAAQAMIKNG
ncbi:MAG: pyruvate, phosphate dikinase [Oscillospiraceae bacterium]|nr:pyruvate, phosphate dikinase [Oscillospiraceae bacterium]